MTSAPGTGTSPRSTRSVLHILVGYDGSDPSYRAVQWAFQIARWGNASVLVVHAATHPPTVMEPRTDEEQTSESDAIRATLQDLKAEAQRQGIPLEAWSREGPPVDVLLGAADEIQADWILVGTRGLRGASRAFLGSVSGALVDRARRPVTVVP